MLLSGLGRCQYRSGASGPRPGRHSDAAVQDTLLVKLITLGVNFSSGHTAAWPPPKVKYPGQGQIAGSATPVVAVYHGQGLHPEYIVKREPSEKDYSDLDEICDDDNDAIPHSDEHNTVNATDFIQDPLMTVLNADSGIDVTQTEDKEVTKLKIELLSYKRETAKLERRRIENAMESDALEASLRLRAARLEAVAAATKLPRSHPALGFTPEEARAEEYLLRYQNT
ncbi:uncharacterized protein LOC114251047 [Bombyx mandarina]|uniref:Uncharacterized protein LOC114251047 n=1 Tax=Bombyx mandarina TaxID=7092 RepID=A0A6J2KG72_BOMMA|nr:uncharacterized protein LOC114251047 [Bombyx mandarina]